MAVARRQLISVRLGGEVDGLVAGGGYLWAYVRDTGVLVRVSQRSGEVRRLLLGGLRGMPVVVAAGAGGVWLANQHSTRPDLIRVDPQTGRIIARPRVPGDSGPITGLAAGNGSLWILVPDGSFPPGWRVLRLDPATNRVDAASADTPGSQLTGHTAAVWVSAGRVWVTGSMYVIVGLDPRTLAMHEAATKSLSEGLVFGGGSAWALDNAGPRLMEINPLSGRAARTLAVPPPSATGDDVVVAAPGLLWVFRGSHLAQLNPTGKTIARTRADPIAPAFYPPAVIVGGNLWYLAKTSRGTALDRITPSR